jgi:hypothetical protein
MLDWNGTEITDGAYLLTGARGNVACEYGMILYHVIKVNGSTVSVERFKVAYQDAKPQISIKKSTIGNKNSNQLSSYILYQPDDFTISLFEKCHNQTLNGQEADFIAKWIHGNNYNNLKQNLTKDK